MYLKISQSHCQYADIISKLNGDTQVKHLHNSATDCHNGMFDLIEAWRVPDSSAQVCNQAKTPTSLKIKLHRKIEQTQILKLDELHTIAMGEQSPKCQS